MAGRLVLLAHAETAATRAASFPVDEGITARGDVRAKELRPDLPAFQQVWRSPAVAARETAEALGFEAKVDPALADLDCGTWRGQAIAQLPAPALAAWRTDPDFVDHGGEALASLLARVAAWLKGRLEYEGTELAVTHAAVLRCTIVAILGAPAAGFWNVDAGPLTQVALSSDGRRWSLRDMVGSRA